MTNHTTAFPTLATTLWPKESGHGALRLLTLALAGAALLTLSAKVQIPFYPVPMTMQTFVVLVIGMSYGSRLGVGTVMLYLGSGAAGLPVFAGTPEKGVGLAYMLGPTGGYLAGFLVAAALCGWLAQRGWDRKPLSTALAMLAGTFAIYVPGLLWLGTVVGWDKPVLQWGLAPFLLGDIAKVLLATATLPLAWRMTGRRRAGPDS